MAWVRIDDGAWDHPKQLQAGPMAVALWLFGLLYSSRQLTDGFVPAVALTTSGVPKATAEADRLVSAGLWERAESGYRIHDYHDYNPSREQVTRKRDAGATRLREWRKRNGNAHGNAHVTPLHVECNTACNINPVPDPLPQVPPIVPQRGTATDEGFAAFWAAYPNRKGKAAAQRKWQSLAPDAALVATILEAVRQHGQSVPWLRDGGKFVPHAATWLNQRRWADEFKSGEIVTPEADAFVETYAAIGRETRGVDYVPSVDDRIAAAELVTLAPDADERERGARLFWRAQNDISRTVATMLRFWPRIVARLHEAA